MSRNNDVFSVLVTKGNKAVLDANHTISDLQPGQIGAFDFNSNMSIVDLKSKKFYLAVGMDTDGDGITDDVMKSTGSHIQAKNLVYATYRPHTPGKPMKVKLKDYVAECETVYGVKLEFRNQEIYRTQGYNQFTKTYAIKTACCNGCTPTCPDGDGNEITKLLKDNINMDPSGLVKAIAVARQALTAATHGVSSDKAVGDELSDADINAIMAYNKTQSNVDNYVYSDLVVETVPMKLASFGNLNVKYFHPRQTIVVMSKIAGFDCTGKVEVIQNATFEEGSGYDVKQLEYQAKGWTESPYRVSSINSLAVDKTYNTNMNEKYDTFVLSHDQFSVGAWLEYLNNQSTLMFVPAVDKTTRDSLATVLKTLDIDTFDFTAAANAANTDKTIVEKTEDKTDATDGI